MHIINLTISCKTATGDGTKIVCMNNDYRVRITTKDCGTFTNSPVKKLIVRHDKEYTEVDIKEEIQGGITILQAVLPPLKQCSYVELGVCGKDTDDSNVAPVYSSTSARFECAKSILCGTAILKSDPKLSTLDVTANGKYRAGNYDVDGFYEVDVNVESKASEERTVKLSMLNGNQEILPSGANRTMTKVTVFKPSTLIPSNIRKDINIGGVTGTYEQKLGEKTIYDNGEYLPDTGYDGFSKVIVNVNQRNVEKSVPLGETFTHSYDADAGITFSSNIITGSASNGVITFEAIGLGLCSITVINYDSTGNIVETVNYKITVVDKDGAVFGTLDITANGEYFVADKESVNVNVPLPEGYYDESTVDRYMSEIDTLIGGV